MTKGCEHERHASGVSVFVMDSHCLPVHALLVDCLAMCHWRVECGVLLLSHRCVIGDLMIDSCDTNNACICLYLERVITLIKLISLWLIHYLCSHIVSSFFHFNLAPHTAFNQCMSAQPALHAYILNKPYRPLTTHSSLSSRIPPCPSQLF